MPVDLISIDGGHNWYFHVTAENHKILVHSEQYTSKQAAYNGIKALADEMQGELQIKEKLV